jgi:hypothetical protein
MRNAAAGGELSGREALAQEPAVRRNRVFDRGGKGVFRIHQLLAPEVR